MRLLCISPDTGRSGAPILLHRQLTALKGVFPALEITTLVYAFGGMHDDWINLCEGRVAKAAEYFRPLTVIDRFLLKTGLKNEAGRKREWIINDQKAATFFSGNCFDLILNNTLTTTPILEVVSSHCTTPVITYAHELALFVQHFFSREKVAKCVALSHAFIVPSNAAADYLCQEYGVNENRVHLLNSLANAEAKEVRNKIEGRKENFRIGVLANPSWIKGYDLFIAACSILREEAGNSISIQWVGGSQNSAEFVSLCESVERAGLNNYVQVSTALTDPLDLLENLDLLVIPSREECMPLVMLEAASLSLPVLAFDGCGGGSDWLSAAGVPLAEKDNPRHLAECILQYQANPGLLKESGTKIYHRYTALHNPETISIQLQQLLLRYARSQSC